jgi:nitrate reductase assembly molybdenum cofactor insertion protein NarJ
MKISFEHYNALADIFRYPEVDYRLKIASCKDLLCEKYPEAYEAYCHFTRVAESFDTWTLEEIYTRTFHIQAICYLDLGYVIFGEDYKRGEFLVNMKREQKEAENDCGYDLPDNLVNILTLLPKLKDYDFAIELCRRILVPGVSKMLKEFESAKISQKKEFLKKKHHAIILEEYFEENIYKHALTALARVLEKDLSSINEYPDLSETNVQSSFLSGCLPQALRQRNQFQY